MSLFSLDAFRALRDANGLRAYADSVWRHRQRLAGLQNPEELRAGFAEEWDKIIAVFEADHETRDILLKRLKREARDALSLQRALIRHEQAEIARVTLLYRELEAHMKQKEIA